MALHYRPIPLALFTALTLLLITYSLRTSFSPRPLPIHDTLNDAPPPVPSEDVTPPPLFSDVETPPPPTISGDTTPFPSPSEDANPPNPPPESPPQSAPEPHKPKHPLYKPSTDAKPPTPIVDNFPLSQSAHSAADLPPIPSWNVPPDPHVQEKTPLLIGFTRNWRILQQCVVSYITAGWPPEDIYVIENTGVMDSNTRGLLSLQNPFFLNQTRLDLLGVNVLVTPTLFTFAQLQNFYLWTAIQNKWPQYFWSHMDVLAMSWEDGGVGRDRRPPPEKGEYKSLYQRAINILRETNEPDWAPASGREYDNSHGLPENWGDKIKQPPLSEQLTTKRWAARFFAYDHLAVVQTKAYEEVGGWDTSIPFYMADCDMHERLFMRGFKITDAEAGYVFDAGTGIDDLEVLYRKKSADGRVKEATFVDLYIAPEDEKESEKAPEHVDGNMEKRDSLRSEQESNNISNSASSQKWHEDDRNSTAFAQLVEVGKQMRDAKNSGGKGRNTWQTRQSGGEGEPYYRDPQGFEDSLNMLIEHGRVVYAEKWGHRECDIINAGILDQKDAWRVLHDWD